VVAHERMRGPVVCCPAMFGMGGTEILVILVVALLFLGPDKLPEAAKTISKGIRDLRKQTRDLQQTIESDTEIGGAIRDIKSALRGEEIRPRPRPIPPPEAAGAIAAAAEPAPNPADTIAPLGHVEPTDAAAGAAPPVATPATYLPDSAGESDAEPADPDAADGTYADLIRPAPGAVAKGAGGDPGSGSGFGA
jgi:sec-independent protein translocase protein TatB